MPAPKRQRAVVNSGSREEEEKGEEEEAPLPHPTRSVGAHVHSYWPQDPEPRTATYPGKVAAMNKDGSYHIKFDDGKELLHVLAKFIVDEAAPASSTSSSSMEAGNILSVDDVVMAEWLPDCECADDVQPNMLSKGTIAAANADGTYAIDYENGTKQSNVLRSMIVGTAEYDDTHKATADKATAESNSAGSSKQHMRSGGGRGHR
jgi:hypothetical protein